MTTMKRTKVSISAAVRSATTAQSGEDFSSWKIGELFALAREYTGLTKSAFDAVPTRTQKVLDMIAQYPKTGKARPIPIAALIAKLTKMQMERPAHPLDATPKVSGRNFVVRTDSEYGTALAYTSSKAGKAVLAAAEKGTLQERNVMTLPYAAVCQYGVVVEDGDPEYQRRQRVAAIGDGLIMPARSGEGFEATVTAQTEAAPSESLYVASDTFAKSFADITGEPAPHQMYDEAMNDDATYEFLAGTVGIGLNETVYSGCVSDNQLYDISEPPVHVSVPDPIPTIVDLAKTLQPKRVGRLTAHMLDGLLVSPALRARMNKIGDIYVPEGVDYVYLDTKDANTARTLIRKYPERKLAVYYRTDNWTNHPENEKDIVRRAIPAKDNQAYVPPAVLKSGVIAWYREFVAPDPERALYVQLKKSVASGVVPKKMEAGTRNVMYNDRERFKYRPNTKYFLIATHVYALNPIFYVKDADVPNYGEYFYVSRNFQSCNVLNTNFEIPGVTYFDRSAILQLMIFLMRWALSYPISRRPCAEVNFQNEYVTLVPPVTLYPFSAKQEVVQLIELAKRKTVQAVKNPYTYGLPVGAKENEQEGAAVPTIVPPVRKKETTLPRRPPTLFSSLQRKEPVEKEEVDLDEEDEPDDW